MRNRYVVKKAEGESFEFGDDRVSIIVSTEDTKGAYSYLRWRVAGDAKAPTHVHEFYEETFYVLSGRLDFYLDGETIPLGPGDFARAPAGSRHGYSNPSKEVAELLVSFSPGGMEQIFLAHRTEGRELDLDAYLSDAKRIHKTEYDLGD